MIMPLPVPNEGEEQSVFISRCMSNESMKKEFPDQKQRTAVCYSQWKEKGKKGVRGGDRQGNHDRPLRNDQKSETVDTVKSQNYECTNCGLKVTSIDHVPDGVCPNCGSPLKLMNADEGKSYDFVSAPNLIIKSFPCDIKTWKDADNKNFMEVPLSGTEVDRDGERMSEKALQGMLVQLKSGKVPVFSNHGLDSNSNRTYQWQDMIGKWVDGKIVDDGTRKLLLGTLMRNEANPEAIKFWEYAISGMPLGFSVGGKTVKHSFEEVEVEE